MKTLWATIGLLCCYNILKGVVLPPSYGKTQFIIGVTEQELRSQNTVHNVTKPRTIKLDELSHEQQVHVFFSPDDNVVDLLVDLIEHEQKKICIAAYMITDKKITQKLIEAHKKGISIELIADHYCVKSDFGTISNLKKHNIPIYVYKGVAPSHAMSNIMHHKFIVFSSNIHNRSLVWTGSFNFTHSAQHYNQENVIILSDSQAIKQFTRQFELLKTRCDYSCSNSVAQRQPVKKSQKKVASRKSADKHCQAKNTKRKKSAHA